MLLEQAGGFCLLPLYLQSGWHRAASVLTQSKDSVPSHSRGGLPQKYEIWCQVWDKDAIFRGAENLFFLILQAKSNFVLKQP